MPIISGQRVTLRAATADDMRALEPVYATVREVAYITRAVPRADHVEGVVKDFVEGLKTVTPTSEVHFAVVANDDDRFCGVVDFYNVDLHHRSVREPGRNELTSQCELGITLVPEARRHGYGTEALALGIDYAFRTRGLHRIVVGTRDDNVGMQALARKLGFRLEATFREKSWFEGRYCDALGFSLLDREWAARACNVATRMRR